MSPSPEVVTVLRDGIFIEVERIADLAMSYARSLGEAAYRGDAVTAEAHIRQLRLCIIAIIKTWKELPGVGNQGL